MRFVVWVCSAMMAGAAGAQPSQTAVDAKLREELRGTREALERLEKGQGILVLLTRIGIDENRLTRLEAQRQSLLAQEQSLEKEQSVAAARTADGSEIQVAVQSGGQIVRPGDMGPGGRTPSDRARRLKEVRQNRLATEAAMQPLRERIAAAEKRVEEALR